MTAPRTVTMPTIPARATQTMCWLDGKTPGSRLDYNFDLTAWLGRDCVRMASVTVAPSGSGDIIIVQQPEPEPVLAVWLSGGNAGTEYAVTFAVTTDAGRILVQTIWLVCQNLSPALPLAPTVSDLSALFVTPAGSAAPVTLAALASRVITPDWLSAVSLYQLGWPVTGANTAVLSPDGQIALTAASRASQLSASYEGQDAQTTIGLAAFAFNDNIVATTGMHCSVYAAYLEAQTLPGSAGLTFCMEMDAVNLSGLPPSAATPGAVLSWGSAGIDTGSTTGLWIASGGGHAGVQDASLAIGIRSNGAKFLDGIVIGADALTTSGGLTWGARLPQNCIWPQWHDASDAAGPFIVSRVASGANGHSLQFQDAGSSFVGAGGNNLFTVGQVVSAVNGVTVVPGTTGNAASIQATGSDSNISLKLLVRGSGIVSTPASLAVGGNLSIAGEVGFFGAAPAAQASVSGAKGGNAALASLLSALAGMGLVTDLTGA